MNGLERLPTDSANRDDMREKKETLPRSSYLLTLRVWREAVGEGQFEWRGQLRYVPTGETRYFRDWAGLVCSVLAVLPPDDSESTPLAQTSDYDISVASK